MSQTSKDELIYMAKLSEQTERFDEMISYMKQIIQQSEELQNEERNLLSIAYKNAVSNKRTAWRALTACEMKERMKNSKYTPIVTYYKKIVEKELDDICKEILIIVDQQIKKSKIMESTVFLYKMKGDYNRYLSEFTEGSKKDKYISEAESSYSKAMELLDSDIQVFPGPNPLRLGVSLNFSVFYYEIKNDIEQAIKKGMDAFNSALKGLESLEQDQAKDSTTIMQLLRDNLTAWEVEKVEEEKKRKDE